MNMIISASNGQNSQALHINSDFPMLDDTQCTDVMFDFCGVLIDWRPDVLLEHYYPASVVQWWLDESTPYNFYHYDDMRDEGIATVDVLEDITEHCGLAVAGMMQAYVDHFPEALVGLLPGIGALLEELERHEIRVWGMTNWAGEHAHVPFEVFPMFNTFQGVLVSGLAHCAKPSHEYYELAMNRFQLTPEHCIFFDDRPANVQGAREVGIHAYQFVNAQQARNVLVNAGILPPR